MKVYDAASIRNVALVGHSGSGKTQLASAILVRRRHGQPLRQGRRRHDRHRLRRRRDRAQAHAVGQPRLRRVEQAEDQPHRHAGHRQLSRRRARRAARRRRRAGRRRRRRRRDGADRESLGGGRRSWRCRGWSSSTGSIASAPASSARWRRCASRAAAPSSRSSCRSARRRAFRGVVDLVSKKAFVFKTDGSGKFTEGAVPADMTAAVDAAREALIEMVAENDEKLMEKFFEAGTLTDEELVGGLRSATIAGKMFPAGLHVGAAEHRRAAAARRDRSRTCRRRPTGRSRASTRPAPRSRARPTRKAPLSAFVWKTIADPFAGRITMFRVVSGVLKADSTVHNKTQGRARAARPPDAAAGQDARRTCRRSRPAISAPSRS